MMSEDFAPIKKIAAHDLFDGRLEEFGIREHISDEPHIVALSRWLTEIGVKHNFPDKKLTRRKQTTATNRCLTDGDNYLWVFVNRQGFVDFITRYGANNPDKILRVIAEAFHTGFVSEQQPQFWGFDTWDEVYAAAKKR